MTDIAQLNAIEGDPSVDNLPQASPKLIRTPRQGNFCFYPTVLQEHQYRSPQVDRINDNHYDHDQVFSPFANGL